MMVGLIGVLAFAAIAAWFIAVIAVMNVVALAPRGRKLQSYFDLGWWRFAALEANIGAGVRPHVVIYRRAFLGFFICILAIAVVAVVTATAFVS
jgi:hypothetical protein